MTGAKIKTFAAILFLSMIFQLTPRPAEAVISTTPGQIMQWIVALYQRVEETMIKTAAKTSATANYKMNWNDTMDRAILKKLKEVFVKWLNKTITKEFSEGNAGKPYFVTDWQDYLYKAPQDFAEEYINYSFIKDALSGNKCGTGESGSQYYDYLCDMAEKVVTEKGVNVKTTLPELFKTPDGSIDTTANPQENLFSTGDLTAFTGYFSCGNNPYCTSQETDSLFAKVTALKKEVAEKEASGEGTLPKKNEDLSIAVPSKIFEYSITDAISAGNQMILNTDSWGEIVMAMASNGVYKLMDQALKEAYHEGTDYAQGYVDKYINQNVQDGTYFFKKYGF